MSFHVVDCEQRTPAWFAARAGMLTASDAAAMLSRPKKGGTETVGRSELRRRLAVESMTGVPIREEHFVSDYMRRGAELEAEAVGVYEAITGELVQTVGFLRHDTLPIGCSPDGIVGVYDGGLELKCPKWTTHWDYLLLKDRVPSEYVAQVTHSLFVTGLPYWEFVSYSPDLPGAARIYRVRVRREDVDLDAYALAFQLFWSEVLKTQDEFGALSREGVLDGEQQQQRSGLRVEENGGERVGVPERLAQVGGAGHAESGRDWARESGALPEAG